MLLACLPRDTVLCDAALFHILFQIQWNQWAFRLPAWIVARGWGRYNAEGCMKPSAETTNAVVRLWRREMLIIFIKQTEKRAPLLLLFLKYVHYTRTDRWQARKKEARGRLSTSSSPAGVKTSYFWGTLIFTACLLAAAKCDCKHCRCFPPRSPPGHCKWKNAAKKFLFYHKLSWCAASVNISVIPSVCRFITTLLGKSFGKIDSACSASHSRHFLLETERVVTTIFKIHELFRV